MIGIKKIFNRFMLIKMYIANIFKFIYFLIVVESIILGVKIIKDLYYICKNNLNNKK